jgi:hypothetical protein
MFTAIEPPETQSLKPAGAEFWHLWTVLLPRRTITGRLVRGRVWRRHDGRRWQYKEFIEYDRMENDTEAPQRSARSRQS